MKNLLGNFKKSFSDGINRIYNRNFKLTYYKDPYHYINRDFFEKEFYQNIEKILIQMI